MLRLGWTWRDYLDTPEYVIRRMVDVARRKDV